jgi:hypothetical protein
MHLNKNVPHIVYKGKELEEDAYKLIRNVSQKNIILKDKN